MLSFSPALYTTIGKLPIPTVAEYKDKLEEAFTQVTDYYVLLFSIIALIFVIKGIIS